MVALVTIVTALWLGVITSISPCPLATNVAAVSVLSRRIDDRGKALWGALAYTLGRVTVYVFLALLLMAGMTTMPTLAGFLRNGITPFLGPILILAGMAILDWLPFPVSFQLANAAMAERISKWGLVGEFFLGFVFALSFCPVSAALFFGSLIPLALEFSAPPLVVAIYGIGTALPVGGVAVIIVYSARRASTLLSSLQSVQKPMLKGTAAILIGIGLWLTVSGFLPG